MNLVSWNIQWCRGVDGRVDPARIADAARAFADFDVLCLQEVTVNFPGLPGNHGEDQLAELARALPGYTALFGAATDLGGASGQRRQFGNAAHPRPAGDADGPFEAAARPTAAILCGDFNFRPGSAEHAAVTAGFEDAATPALLDAWSVAHPGQPHEITAGLYDPAWPEAYCCDFVFVSEDLSQLVEQVEVESRTQASDHQPLLLTVTV